MLILYIVDTKAQEFFFFENTREGNTKAKEKETELAERYGYETIYDTKVPPFPKQLKTLKNYYGTVWLCIKWSKGVYSIHSRWKDAKENIQYGYKVIKFELSPFEKTPGAKETSYWLESNKQTMVKRRSPGFD